MARKIDLMNKLKRINNEMKTDPANKKELSVTAKEIQKDLTELYNVNFN